MNPVAERLTGKTLLFAIGKPIEQIFIVYDEKKKYKLQTDFDGLIHFSEFPPNYRAKLKLTSANQQEYHISFSVSIIKDEHLNPIGLVLIFRDVTDNLKMEQQLQHSQKMDSIGKLAGGIAHDFNNMLAGIIGFAELSKMYQNNPDKQSAYITRIVNTADRAAALTKQLLTFSRKNQNLYLPFSINDEIKSALSILERSLDKRIKIEKRMRAQDSIIFGDPSQIQNAILNLAVNARDAMPQGGDLIVATENINLSDQYLKRTGMEIDSGYYIHLSVQDTGVGIEPENIKLIFDPFYTTKDIGEGTGLGLATVYGTIQDHKGTILVDSAIGLGTTFHIYLPAFEDQNILASYDKNEVIFHSGTVLMIDDEEIIRQMGLEILTHLGYQVFTAENGIKGLEVFRNLKNKIDVVIIDLNMPKMNGIDCFKELKIIKPNVKVILSTGYINYLENKNLMSEGFSGFVNKPYKQSQLSQELKRVIELS